MTAPHYVRCPACRKPCRTSAGFERHIDTHRDEHGKPRCNCLLPVELMGYSHQLACPVTWLPWPAQVTAQ
jgi:hypothetical protein